MGDALKAWRDHAEVRDAAVEPSAANKNDDDANDDAADEEQRVEEAEAYVLSPFRLLSHPHAHALALSSALLHSSPLSPTFVHLSFTQLLPLSLYSTHFPSARIRSPPRSAVLFNSVLHTHSLRFCSFLHTHSLRFSSLVGMSTSTTRHEQTRRRSTPQPPSSSSKQLRPTRKVPTTEQRMMRKKMKMTTSKSFKVWILTTRRENLTHSPRQR